MVEAEGAPTSCGSERRLERSIHQADHDLLPNTVGALLFLLPKSSRQTLPQAEGGAARFLWFSFQPLLCPQIPCSETTGCMKAL